MLFKKILTAALSLTFVLVGVELASFAYLRHHFGRYGYDLHVQALGSMAENSYQVWAAPPKYTAWSLRSHFEEHGFQYPETVTVDKPEGVRRIFIFGGSTAYGAQPSGIWQGFTGQRELAIDETIAGRMERLLNERYPGEHFQVINAATNWSKLHQQMIHYAREVKDFSPDLVISIDGQNDATLHNGGLNVWDMSERAYDEEVLSTMQYRLRPVLRSSNAMYLLAMLTFGGREIGVDTNLIAKYEHVERPADYNARLAAFYSRNRQNIDGRVDEYEKNMRYFHEMLSVDNVPHLFVLQPLIHLDTTKPLTRNERAIRGYIFSNIDTYLWRDSFYRRLDEDASRLSKGYGLPFRELTQPFEGFSDEAYTDYCHLTPEGNRAFAERLIALAESAYPRLFAPAAAQDLQVSN